MKTKKLGPAKFGPSQKEVRPEPKYTNFEGLEAGYGISKGKAYPIIARGDIKIIRLVEPGKSRGKVLIDVASVEAYLARLAAEQAVEVPA
jgi:hypothetical protein